MGRDRDDRDRNKRGWGEGDHEVSEPRYFQRNRPAPASTAAREAVDADVLWFNAAKGFGFVQPLEGEKAFLHAAQLAAAGHGTVSEGMRLKVVIQPGPKGLSVTEVLEVGPAPEGRVERERRSPPPPRDEATQEAEGTVKWFNAEKGFGFVGRNEGGKDIFVHASALARSNIPALADGQAVIVRYVEGAKGLEARTLRIK